jgi:hypothetical protein
LHAYASPFGARLAIGLPGSALAERISHPLDSYSDFRAIASSALPSDQDFLVALTLHRCATTDERLREALLRQPPDSPAIDFDLTEAWKKILPGRNFHTAYTEFIHR